MSAGEAGLGKVLVTGNMGYVGPLVTRELSDTGSARTLIGLDTGYFAHCLTGKDAVPERLLDCQYFIDIRDCPDELLAKIDTVIHLAALSNDPLGATFETATEAINGAGTVDFAKRARQAGVKRFVFASSCSLYGAASDDARDEDDPLNPLTTYARSKQMVELALESLANQDFIVSCLRFATACGWSPRLRLDLVLNDFVASAIATGRIDVLSNGEPWRPLIHVEDMARALVWAAGRRLETGGAFLTVNVGRNDWNYRVKDLAQAVAAAIDGVSVTVNESAPADRRSYRVSFDRLTALAPAGLIRRTLNETIRELRDRLLESGFCDRHFRNSSLIRLTELKRLRESGALTHDLRWMTGSAAAEEKSCNVL
jgi:nucleoside-diphosphate-sugar epimerase